MSAEIIAMPGVRMPREPYSAQRVIELLAERWPGHEVRAFIAPIECKRGLRGYPYPSPGGQKIKCPV